MNIQNRITFSFSLIVGIILLAFSIVIYLFSSQYREEQFYSRLKEKSLTTAKLLFEVDQVDSILLKIIDKADLTLLFKEKVVIFDKAGNKMYDSKEDLPLILNDNDLRKIWENREERFSRQGFEVFGLRFHEKSEEFIVVASAYDKFGYSKVQNLAKILFACLLLSVSFLYITGRLFARKLLVPISDIIDQVEGINVSNLNIRVYGGSSKDEINHLANTFNNMLERLQAAFDIQRDFVSHASHELRTPLTSIIGQIDVALMNERQGEEYREVLHSIREDIDTFVDLTNKLLLLAQTNEKLPTITILDLRLDEVLWQARTEVLKRHEMYKVNIEFVGQIDDDMLLNYQGSLQLLRIAFINLMDNACKYSIDHSALVQVGVNADDIRLDFFSKSIPMDVHETEQIFDPFYRASNSRGTTGHGIGLSLVKNIINIHQGMIHVSGLDNELTLFSINLPRNRAIGLMT